MPSNAPSPLAAAFDPIIGEETRRGAVSCAGESVWAEAGRRWQEAQGRTGESLNAEVRDALQADLSLAGGALTTPPFALRLVGSVPTTFHILLGFAVAPDAAPLTARLEVGGTVYGAPVALVPGALAPALTLADGRGYAVPVPTYHDMRLLGAPTDGSVHAVGVRVSEAGARALAARPSCVGGEVAFAMGCAMAPAEAFLRIPPLGPPGPERADGS